VDSPAGLQLTCASSALGSEYPFLVMLRRASFYAGRQAQILKVSGAGGDHPVLAHVKESRYLKAVLLRVL
jgi:23S rRNA (cytosine1962-C5)-methyltransferase